MGKSTVNWLFWTDSGYLYFYFIIPLGRGVVVVVQISC